MDENETTPKVPEPLSPEAIKQRVDIIAQYVAKEGCADIARGNANKMVDLTKGGNRENLLNAIPALRAAEDAEAVGKFVAAADVVKAKPGEAERVDTVEQTALLLTAVRLAVKAQAPDISAYLKNLRPDKAYFEEVCNVYNEITAPVCRVDPKNDLKGILTKR